MRGYGMTAAALCAGAASGCLAAYVYYTKKKAAALASAALDQPEAAQSVLKKKQEEVASDRPSSPSFQLRVSEDSSQADMCSTHHSDSLSLPAQHSLIALHC